MMTLTRVSFGRVRSVSAGDALLALVAALLWQALVVIIVMFMLFESVPYDSSEWLVALGWEYRSRDQVIAKNLFIAGVVISIVWMTAYIGWSISRIGQTKATGPAAFAICQWRACLLGTIVLPVAVGLSIYALGLSYAGLALGMFYLLIAPGALSPRVLPTPQRWRPVCPECGHTVAYAVLPRCSECGEAYPLADKFYRRWAIPRVPWEKTNRSWFFAYFQTVFLILFRPGLAAWRLGTPSQMGRAVRWAVFHALGPYLLYILLFVVMSAMYWGRVFPPFQSWYPPAIVPADEPLFFESLQPVVTLLCWQIAVVVFPVCVGLTLAAYAPRVQPAARRGLYKWTLYAAVAPVGILTLVLAAIVTANIALILRPVFAPPPALIGFVYELISLPRVICAALIAVYAIWWSIGVASQPYFRRRGFVVFLLALLAFTVTCAIVPLVFDLRGLGALL